MQNQLILENIDNLTKENEKLKQENERIDQLRLKLNMNTKIKEEKIKLISEEIQYYEELMRK